MSSKNKVANKVSVNKIPTVKNYIRYFVYLTFRNMQKMHALNTTLVGMYVEVLLVKQHVSLAYTDAQGI